MLNQNVLIWLLKTKQNNGFIAANTSAKQTRRESPITDRSPVTDLKAVVSPSYESINESHTHSSLISSKLRLKHIHQSQDFCLTDLKK